MFIPLCFRLFLKEKSKCMSKLPRKLSLLPKHLFTSETKLLPNIAFPEFSKLVLSTHKSSKPIFLCSANMKIFLEHINVLRIH